VSPPPPVSPPPVVKLAPPMSLPPVVKLAPPVGPPPMSPPPPAKLPPLPAPSWSRAETAASFMAPTRWTTLASTPVVPAAYVTTAQVLFEEERNVAADLGRPVPEMPRHMVVGLPGLPVAVLLPPAAAPDAATVLWLSAGPGVGADAGKADR